MKEWDNLKCCLDSRLIEALKECKFLQPTRVQIATIPKLVKYQDVVVEAITGSGKTLAFVVPLLENLLSLKMSGKYEIHSIIICPTRELAQQIYQVFKLLLAALKLDTSLAYMVGGQTLKEAIYDLEDSGCNIIIATPGRLLQLLSMTDFVKIDSKSKREMKMPVLSCLVKNLKYLILDEADRLVDLGFIKTVSSILIFLPKQRRTALLSATLRDGTMKELIMTGLRNPVEIYVKQASITKDMDEDCINRAPSLLQHLYVKVESHQKLSRLISFLKEKNNEKIMVFMPTCACADFFTDVVKTFMPHRTIMNLHRKIIHRQKVLDKFSSCDNGILLCTDVVSRGIDIPDIDWVIQYEAPSCPSSFVHRAGRTARMGKKGYSLVYLAKSELLYLDFMKRNQKIEVEEMKQEIDFIFENELKSCILTNRDLYLKSIKAFVSFIQFYKKHECYMILNYRELVVDHLAMQYGLLHLPRMTEIGRMMNNDTFKRVMIDYDTIPFLNVEKEKDRQITLLEPKQPKKKRKTKNVKKPSAKKPRKTNKDYNFQDVANVNADLRAIKRFKNNKISKEEFDDIITSVKDTKCL